MDHRAGHKPHVADARYALLVPDPDELYRVRRLLHLSYDEWRALPWWEQRALREGMFVEANPGVEMTPAAFAEDEMAAAGITVNTST